MNSRCINCKCFVNLDDSGVGQCHLKPPQLITLVDNSRQWSFPGVRADNWCMQYMDKEVESEDLTRVQPVETPKTAPAPPASPPASTLVPKTESKTGT